MCEFIYLLLIYIFLIPAVIQELCLTSQCDLGFYGSQSMLTLLEIFVRDNGCQFHNCYQPAVSKVLSDNLIFLLKTRIETTFLFFFLSFFFFTASIEQALKMLRSMEDLNLWYIVIPGIISQRTSSTPLYGLHENSYSIS